MHLVMAFTMGETSRIAVLMELLMALENRLLMLVAVVLGSKQERFREAQLLFQKE